MIKTKKRQVEPREIEIVKNSGLFDIDWFSDVIGERFDTELAAIHRYLELAQYDSPTANYLFDESWYLLHNQDLRRDNLRPLIHFVLYGANEMRRPSPFFDQSWYAQTYDIPTGAVDRLLQYHCSVGRALGNEPNHLFDGKWYLEVNADVREDGRDPLGHYISTGAVERRDPSASFSTRWYLAKYPALLVTGENPLAHYLTHGSPHGGRVHYEPFDKSTVSVEQRHGWAHLERHSVFHARRGRKGLPDRNKPKLLFVTHEMSRTGAPLIILNIIKYFSRFVDYEIITFTDQTGELFSEFLKYSHVVDMARHRHDDENLNLGDLLVELGDTIPALAICNTANTNHYSGAFSGFGIPTISLVHEMLYVYPVDYIERLYTYSARVVFPAAYVMDVADKRVALPDDRAVVLPQGLLDPNFVRKTRETALNLVRREFGIPHDAMIVLGCGTVCIRKGVDLFVSVARQIHAEMGDAVHFVWLGSETSEPAYTYWMKKDVVSSGLEEVFHFAGQQDDTAPYYQAADVFAMTSREDPFPCVIHEAMTCGVPIVAFADAGGAPEALAEGSGVVTPYRDIPAMANAVTDLLRDKTKHADISARAKARVDTNYRFEDYCAKLVDLANNALGAGLSGYLAPRSSDRPKVIFFCRDWWISGVNSFSETLISYLRDHDIDAQLVFPSFNDHNVEHLPDLPMTFLKTEGTMVEQWQSLLDYVEDEAPCILVPNYDYISSAITPALPNNVGVIGIVHSDDVEHYDHVVTMGRYWNAMVCSNSHLCEKVGEINPSFLAKTSIIPYGVSVPNGRSRTADRGKDQPVRIVFCGRLMQHQKRVRDLVGITRALSRDNVPFHLTVIGEGDELSWLKQQWHQLIQKGLVELTGRLSRDEMYDVFRETDVFTLVSDFEGMPISLIEAMACGCVPVVSDIPSGIPDLVQPETGLFFPIGDVRGAAAQIALLQRDPELLARLSRGAMERIASGFRTEDMGESYLALIQKIWGELASGAYMRPDPLVWRGPLRNVLPPAHLFPIGR